MRRTAMVAMAGTVVALSTSLGLAAPAMGQVASTSDVKCATVGKAWYDGGSNHRYIYNNCNRTISVKVELSPGKDSVCYTIGPLLSKKARYASIGVWAGLKDC